VAAGPQANRWRNFRGLIATPQCGVLGVPGPLTWPAARAWSTCALRGKGSNQRGKTKRLLLFGGAATDDNIATLADTWTIDLYGTIFNVDVCASNPCANGGVCTASPDVALGGGAGYRCSCPLGWTDRHCSTGDGVRSDLNNPFINPKPLPGAIPKWKPPPKPHRPIPKPAPCCSLNFPVTVGPGYVPNTETRTVTLLRDPDTERPPLPVTLDPAWSSDPKVIEDARRHLKSTTKAIQEVHNNVRRITNAPLTAPLQPA